MAYKLVDDVINHDVGDAIAKLILIALARFANQNNQCFPSLAKICEVTHLSNATVCRKLNWLEQNGFVSRETSKGVSTRYTLRVSQRDQVVSERDTKLSVSNTKHTIPDEWVASKELRSSINAKLKLEVDHDYEETRFRSWNQAHGKKLKDWDAGYKLWCNRIDPERSPRSVGRIVPARSSAKQHQPQSSFFSRAARSLTGT